jgi:hypothetical protein
VLRMFRTKALRGVFVRRVIRHKSSLKYFCSGHWIEDVRVATDFPDVETVFKVRREYNLKDAEFYLMVGSDPSARDDVVLPLSL